MALNMLYFIELNMLKDWGNYYWLRYDGELFQIVQSYLKKNYWRMGQKRWGDPSWKNKERKKKKKKT